MTTSQRAAAPTPSEILARADAMRSRLVDLQDETERRTHYSQETHEAFLKAGFYRMLVPKRFGGYEFDLPSFWRVVIAIARGCPSTAWCLCLAAGHALQVGSLFEEEAQVELFGDGDFRCAAVAAPAGLGHPTPYRSSVVRRSRGAVFAAEDGVAVNNAFFEPKARTHWHTHAVTQVLYVLAGAGWAQVRGGGGEPLTAGDTVHIPAGEEHWHGASADTCVLHLAVSVGETIWLDPVSDEDYEAAIGANGGPGR